MVRFFRIVAILAAALMLAIQPGVAVFERAAVAELAQLDQTGENTQCSMTEASPPISSPLFKNGEGKDLVQLAVKFGLVESVTAEIDGDVSQPAHHAALLPALCGVSSLQHLSIRWQI